jgi:hypothetical protein
MLKQSWGSAIVGGSGVPAGLYDWIMHSDVAATGAVRSSALLNKEIRALWQQAGGHLSTPDERAKYERLLAEWLSAVQRERAETQSIR